MDDNSLHHPHAMPPNSGSDDPVILNLLAVLHERESLYAKKGRRWPKSSAKRLELEQDIQKARVAVDQAMQLLRGQGDGPAHAPELGGSRRSSMSTTEDFHPSSPLTSSPNSESGSPPRPQTDLRLMPRHEDDNLFNVEAAPSGDSFVPIGSVSTSTTGNAQLGDEEASIHQPHASMDQSVSRSSVFSDPGPVSSSGMPMTGNAQLGDEEASIHQPHAPMDQSVSHSSVFSDPGPVSSSSMPMRSSVVEHVHTLSHRLRSLNERFDQADQARSSKAQEPYRSELVRAFGTPPKMQRPWSQWPAFYNQQNQFSDYFPPQNEDRSVSAPDSEYQIQPEMDIGHMVMDMRPQSGATIDRSGTHTLGFHPDEPSLNNGPDAGFAYSAHKQFSATLEAENPSRDNPDMNLVQGPAPIENNASAHLDHHHMYQFKEERDPTFYQAENDINMSVEPLRPEPAVVTINAAPGIPVRPTKPRVLAFTPEEHNLKLSGLKVERIVSQNLSLLPEDKDTDGRAKRPRSRPYTITGRYGVDMSKIGIEQFKIENFRWGSYDDLQKDWEAYLAVLKKSRYRRIPEVANENPTSFSKDAIFKQPEQGAPFAALPEVDRAILMARGRVAITQFLEEATKFEALLPTLTKDSKKPCIPRLHPNWVKKLALTNATYLPEAATTDVRVSLEFLTNTNREIIFRHHQSDRNNKTDAPLDGHFKITSRPTGDIITRELHGVAYAKAKSQEERHPNHAHCGCSLKDILLDWYLFKTRGATSSNTDPKLNLTGQTFFQHTSMSTLPRAYYVALFTSLTGFDGTSDGLYSGTDGWGQELGDWNTPAYKYRFHMGILDTTFKAMGVDPYVLFAPQKTDNEDDKRAT